MARVEMVVEDHPEWPGAEPRDDLLFIGYWRPATKRISKKMRYYPDPREHVDPNWEPTEKALVLQYLRDNQKVLYSWSGSSTCRICKLRPCGERFCYEDGVYGWPAGFAHYIEEHDVRVPYAFVEHIMLRARGL